MNTPTVNYLFGLTLIALGDFEFGPYCVESSAGLIHNNEAGQWLQLGLATALLSAGFVPANTKSKLIADTMATR